MFCEIKFLLTFACLSLGVFKSKKIARNDELLSDANSSYRNVSNQSFTESNKPEPFDSKNCEFFPVLIRRTSAIEKSSLRKLTILKHETERFAILDLNQNDRLNVFSNKKGCLNFKKHWSVCLKSHQSDPVLFDQLDIGDSIEIESHSNATAVNHKNVKKEQLKDFNVLARKHSRRLNKRASHFNFTLSDDLKSDSLKSSDFNQSKQSAGLTESQFLLINCDFKDSESSQCKMIKLVKRGCFRFRNSKQRHLNDQGKRQTAAN